MADVSHFCALQLPREPGVELNHPFGSNLKYLGHCSKRLRENISSSLSDSDNDDHDDYEDCISNSCISLSATNDMKFRFDRKYHNGSIVVHKTKNGEKNIKNKSTILPSLTCKIKARENNNCNIETNCKILVSNEKTAILNRSTHAIVNSDNSNDDDNDDSTIVSEEHSASGECSEDAYQDMNNSNDVDVDVGIQSENTSVEMSTESGSSSSSLSNSSSPTASERHSLSHPVSLPLSKANTAAADDDYGNICPRKSNNNYTNKHNLRISSQTEFAANGLRQQNHGKSNGNMNNVVDNADSPITDGSDSP